MLFNSPEFAVFLPIVFLLYWLIPSRQWKAQNIVLLIASYFFYSCWDWRFTFLLIFSTTLDYYSGLKIARTEDHGTRKIWLWTTVSINVGFLALFKYYNFFITALPLHTDFSLHNIILPVGISFYTFHGLSYVIDIYNNRIKPEYDLITYGLFVSFFPLLIAGPIERANHLLPQLNQSRTFSLSQAVDGLRQILWGLFKKLVVADNCATYANVIFGDTGHHSGSTLLLGAVFFAFQIYGDFSGYSDIALGVARVFGIDLLRNFAFPYFSRDIAEFWRRWNVSLSSWFRDYLYIPLGGSRVGKWEQVRNVFIVFIASGFWHGANWTFMAWGALNAVYFMPLLLWHRHKKHIDIASEGNLMPAISDFIRMAITFTLVVLGWILFRSNSIGQAIEIYGKIFSDSLHIPVFNGIAYSYATMLLTGLMIIVEWIGRNGQYGIENIKLIPYRSIRWTLYIIIISIIALYMQTTESPFIYFQF